MYYFEEFHIIKNEIIKRLVFIYFYPFQSLSRSTKLTVTVLIQKRLKYFSLLFFALRVKKISIYRRHPALQHQAWFRLVQVIIKSLRYERLILNTIIMTFMIINYISRKSYYKVSLIWISEKYFDWLCLRNKLEC